MLASCLLSSGFSGKPSSNATDVDVVIVGAGYAGLVTARQLTAQGVTVQVLEALPEAGGRARDYTWASGPHHGHTLELGVAIIGNDEQMPYANGLLRELNVSTFDFPVWGPGNCTGGLSGGHCNTSLLCRNGEGAINKFSTLFPGIVTHAASRLEPSTASTDRPCSISHAMSCYSHARASRHAGAAAWAAPRQSRRCSR